MRKVELMLKVAASFVCAIGVAGLLSLNVLAAGGTVNASNVNIRSAADTTANSVGVANTNDVVTIETEVTGTDGKTWYSITTASGVKGFIRSDEAGKFLAFLVDKDYKGAINGSAEGTISIREIIDYVRKKTGTKAVISKVGDDAPYNGEPEYSINAEQAKNLGYRFSTLKDWIFELLDYYIGII